MSIFQINSNIGAMQAYNALKKVNADTTKAQLRLATQKRINSASDDTSGYNVGKSLEGRVSVMKSAQGNVAAAKDMLSTTETALQNINDLLNQIKSKVGDASDPTKNKSSLANDVVALGNEITNIINRTDFNGTTLLTGFGSGFTFQTGVASTDTLSLGYTSKLGTVDISSVTGATSATVASLDVSATVTKIQDSLGSVGNDLMRLDVQDNYLTTSITNASSSISRLFDADMAMEQLNATKGSISQQAGIAMLAQLNTAPQQILSLFR